MRTIYSLVVDVYSKKKIQDLSEFREQVYPSLLRLNYLQGVFGKAQDTIDFYPPLEQPEIPEQEFCFAKGVVLVSLGKKRSDFLLKLFESIVDLIVLELPLFDIRARIGIFEPS